MRFPSSDLAFTTHGAGVTLDERGATFTGEGWLAFSPTAPTSVSIRARVDRPGGLFATETLSLVVMEGGLVVALVGMGDAEGEMLRELPLGFIPMGEWHDLAFLLVDGRLEFYADGELKLAPEIGGEPAVVFQGPTMLGGWKIPDPALPGFPPHVVDMLFQRLFAGAIESFETGTADFSRRSRETGDESFATPILADYRAFHDASRRKDVAACAALGQRMRRFMASDPQRPIYHLTAPTDAILDPAGAFYHEGEYHVFSYRNMVSLLACTPLAHFVSDDMIHWRDRPIAIWADSELDNQGIWLANIVLDDDGVPAMLYTAQGERGKIAVLARSHDGLVSFTDKKAVIADIVHHDGHAWREGDGWLSLSTEQHWGRREGDLGDGILLLRSPDLEHWENLSEIFAARKHPNPVDDQQRWGFTEYPYLLEFEGKHVLMTGTRPSTYWIGRFDPSIPAFLPDDPEPRLLDHLNPFHCFNPMTVAPDGRRIVYAMHLYAKGSVEGIVWYGVHTLPRVLTREGDRLRQEPVVEAESLRGERVSFKTIHVEPGVQGHLPGVEGDALEIRATFQPGADGRFGVTVRKNTLIWSDPSTGEFGVEGGLLTPAAYPELGHGPSYLDPDAPVTFRIFLDKCLLEVFVNGQTATGILQADPSDVGLDLFAEGESVRLIEMDVWQMRGIFPA
ncbi:hypothetical protein EON81_19295 [bacterium]|nr:MAG: hypothetical protein EON81_19295 [bacterium]